MSRPTTRAAVSAISTLSGWASMVRSIDVPPVLMLPVSASLTKTPASGHRIGREALALEDLLGVLVELDPGEDLLVADAAAGVRVRDLDQLADRPLAVAGDAGGDALRDRRDLAADHEAAVVAAGDEGLDDDVAAAALVAGLRPGGRGRRPRPAGPGDAAAVVAVQRLDDAREADAPGGADRVVLRVDDLRARHGQAGGVQEPVGELLVGRDVDRDAAGAAGHRGPDSLLVDALAQLDQAVPVEADERDVADRGLVEERLGGRAEGEALGEADQALQLRLVVEGERGVVGGDQVVDERDGLLAGLDPDLLLAVLEDDVVAAVLAGAARLAVADQRCRRGSAARARCAPPRGPPRCPRGGG